jgi:hypothetical protein
MTDPRGDHAWDDEDRAIARALGAEIPDGAGSTVDADALADYETVLATMPFAAVEPRAGLEDDVIAAALAQRPAAARAIDARRRAGRNVSTRWIAIGGVAAAAAAIALVLALGATSTGTGAPGGRIAPASSSIKVAQVLAAPGTRTAVLRTGNGVLVGKVALGADGQGFVYDLAPAKLGAARWLWLDVQPAGALVGRMPDAGTIHFVVRGDVREVKGVLVTPEPVLTPGLSRASATFDGAN